MCHIMVFEAALTSPEIGNIIQSFLYADELVFAFNLSWELREHFLGDICDICCGLRAWGRLQDEIGYQRALEHDVRRQLRREAYSAGSSDSESSSSWG